MSAGGAEDHKDRQEKGLFLIACKTGRMSLAFVVVIARFSVYLTFCDSVTVGDIYTSFTHAEREMTSQIPTKTHRTSGFVIQINICFSFYYLLR